MMSMVANRVFGAYWIDGLVGCVLLYWAQNGYWSYRTMILSLDDTDAGDRFAMNGVMVTMWFMTGIAAGLVPLIFCRLPILRGFCFRVTGEPSRKLILFAFFGAIPVLVVLIRKLSVVFGGGWHNSGLAVAIMFAVEGGIVGIAAGYSSTMLRHYLVNRNIPSPQRSTKDLWPYTMH
jgi:hypothetical protein